MDYNTAISKLTKEDHIIRGERLETLVEQGSFSDAVFFILRGVKPSEAESKLFAAMLITSIDHGMGTASSQAARFVASGGNTINTAVAGGLLALGEYHGGAIEKAMIQLGTVSNVEQFVKNALNNKEVIYGFGHKIHKDVDPRSQQLIQLARTLGFTSPQLDLCLAIEQEIEAQKGEKLPLNIDGVMAALLLTMDFDPLTARGVFIIARTPGLVAQAVEEITTEKPVRRVDEEAITYQGK